MISQADAVVIGAGALGVSAAFHLAQAGLKRVALVDKFEAGSQSSPRAAGLFKQVQGDAVRTQLALLSIRKMINFAAETGEPLPVTRSGSLLIARTSHHARMVQSEQHHARQWGVEIESIDASTAKRLCPLLETDDLLAVCHIPDDIYIAEPTDLINAYLRASERQGVAVLSNTPVTGIEIHNHEVRGVVTPRGTITAPIVVDAAGGWARAVGDLGRVYLPILPVRHQLYITEPMLGVEASQPIARFIDSAIYVRPARGGLMLGVFEPDPLPVDPRTRPCNFSMCDLTLDWSVLERHRRAVEKNLPSIRDARVQEHRGGLFTMTADGRFIIGPVPGLHGFWALTGCNGSGFSFSPALGQMLAEWITAGSPSIDLTSLALGRFAALAINEERLQADCVWQYGHYYDPIQ